jgi:hypothetical protein
MRILDKLYDVYILYIWSVLESSAVAWHSSLSKGQELEIERVQRYDIALELGL